jgi:hypothetical protein
MRVQFPWISVAKALHRRQPKVKSGRVVRRNLSWRRGSNGCGQRPPPPALGWHATPLLAHPRCGCDGTRGSAAAALRNAQKTRAFQRRKVAVGGDSRAPSAHSLARTHMHGTQSDCHGACYERLVSERERRAKHRVCRQRARRRGKHPGGEGIQLLEGWRVSTSIMGRGRCRRHAKAT